MTRTIPDKVAYRGAAVSQTIDGQVPDGVTKAVRGEAWISIDRAKGTDCQTPPPPSNQVVSTMVILYGVCSSHNGAVCEVVILAWGRFFSGCLCTATLGVATICRRRDLAAELWYFSLGGNKEVLLPNY